MKALLCVSLILLSLSGCINFEPQEIGGYAPVKARFYSTNRCLQHFPRSATFGEDDIQQFADTATIFNPDKGNANDKNLFISLTDFNSCLYRYFIVITLEIKASRAVRSPSGLEVDIAIVYSDITNSNTTSRIYPARIETGATRTRQVVAISYRNLAHTDDERLKIFLKVKTANKDDQYPLLKLSGSLQVTMQKM
jgi:hypothetical protein